MSKKYQRKEFLKTSLIANIGFCFNRFPISKNILALTEITTGENVIFYKKEDKEYETLRKGFNKRIEKFPSVIALCKNEQGIIEALEYAKNKNLPVAVKSGGHSMEGFSCNDGGLVINLSLLNNIEWINDETIKVGPACTLSKLYDFVLEKNKILPGGSCGTVGVGGLTLGGGYGLLSRKLGLTCDGLIEVTMIDANGRIINSKDDKDLLWACKGGANGNFGIISEMKFKVYKSPEMMQSFRFKAFKVNFESAKAILKEWFNLTKNLPEHCFSAFVMNNINIYILLTCTEKINVEVQKIIDTLSLLTDKHTKTSPQPLAKAIKTFYGIQHPVKFKNACAGLYKSFDDIESFIDKVLKIVTHTDQMIFQVNTIGGQIQNADAELLSSFPHREFFYVSELQTYWEDDDDGKESINNFEQVQKIFSENKISAQYCNYPDINFKNYESLYYGKNYQKLQQIKNKYDPDNLIRHEQSIKNY